MNLTKKIAATVTSAALACMLLPLPSFAAPAGATAATAAASASAPSAAAAPAASPTASTSTTGTASASTAAGTAAATETRTVTWLSTEQQPTHAKTITVAGTEYAFTGATDPQVVKEEYGTTEATKTQWQECAPANLQATINSFATSMHIDENGYAGDIPQTGVTYVPTQAERSWEVNASRTYAGLPTNDVAQIAREIAYTNPDTGNALTLALAGISWQVTATDEAGFPTSYTANCIYRGQDADTVTDHYTVTATYAGEVTAKEPVLTYQATLTYAATAPEVAPAIEVETQVQAQPFDWLPLAAGAALAAAVIGAGFLYWYRSREVRICLVKNEQAAAATLDKKSLKTVARVRAKNTQSGEQAVNLPETLNIATTRYALLLPSYRANGSVLNIMQCNKQLLSLKAYKIVPLF